MIFAVLQNYNFNHQRQPSSTCHRDQGPSSTDALPTGLGLLPWRPLCRSTSQEMWARLLPPSQKTGLRLITPKSVGKRGATKTHRPQAADGMCQLVLGEAKIKGSM